MRSHVLSALTLAAIGCGGAAPQPVPDRETPPGPVVAAPEDDVAPAPPPPAARTLTLVVDGAKVPIASVIAAPQGDDVEIQITSLPYSCDEWVAGFREKTNDDEITVSVQLHPNLSPAGERGWAIRGTAFQNTTSSAQDGGDPVPGARLDASPGAHSQLELALDLETMDDPPRKARLEGPVDALGCGPLTWRGDETKAPPARLDGITLTVAGQDIPVGGAAYLLGDRGWELLLSSEPVSCVEGAGSVDSRHFLSSSSADVTLGFTGYGKGPDVDRAALGGELLGKGGSTNDLGGAITVLPGPPPKKKSKGTPQIPVTLAGATELGGYRVEVSGTVKATLCR